MEIRRTSVLAAPPATVFALVDDLGRYPEWMDLVHLVSVSNSTADGAPAWDVELRAKVGPLARSKRLRMVRTVHEPPQRVVFERAEVDGRQHSPWVLQSVLEPIDDGSVELAMTLSYGGSLWTGVVLERVLDDHVVRGAEALAALVSPNS
jgi:uncharacterized protein YndB with AHSA1/START domain